jgi:Tfp pilus assembly protein PilF
VVKPAGALLAIALAVLTRSGAAQLPEAEDAFLRGDYRTARALYDSVLAHDSLNARALYRRAILDSWDGKLQRSLARFATLRQVEPHDPDVWVAHARVLSWAGQTRWSEALYDSVLAISPERADALAGRARAAAWDGDLERAERLWRDALARHPDDPEILTGLAQTLYWQGQPALAEGYVARARQLAPDDPTARGLLDQVRAERRPLVSVSSDATDDIEHNASVILAGSFSASVSRTLRGTLRTAWRRNDDGPRSAVSRGLDGVLVRAFRGGGSLRAGLGARVLDPDSGAPRSFGTVQVGLGLRPASFASVGLAYARSPFDETALLVRRAFVWDELDASAELSPRPALSLSAAANAAWLSDGNRRLIGSLAALAGVTRGLRLGGYARILGYRDANPGRGYFAPDRFTLAEARAVYVWRRTGWAVRTTGGVGVQQVGTEGATQAEWHGDLLLSRSWRAIDELALVAAYTNSAAARSATATTPIYRYWSVGLRYRRGL